VQKISTETFSGSKTRMKRLLPYLVCLSGLVVVFICFIVVPDVPYQEPAMRELEIRQELLLERLTFVGLFVFVGGIAWIVARLAQLSTSGSIERLGNKTSNTRAISPLRKSLCCVLCIIVVTVVVTYVVGTVFYTPTSIGYIEFPGVIITVVSALICSTAFCICPRQPFFGKSACLILTVPSLWLAIDATASWVCIAS
jgi:hypothetical protein